MTFKEQKSFSLDKCVHREQNPAAAVHNLVAIIEN